MIIKLPKPTCPDCKSKNIRIYSSNQYCECNNCGADFLIDIVWQDEQTFCNCDLCKTLNLIKYEV